MHLPLPFRVAAEGGLEAVLRLDPDTRAKLDALDGKVVAIDVTAPDISIVLSVVDRRIHLIGNIDTPADTTLSGTLAAMVSLGKANDALYRGEVAIEGDVGVGLQLKQIIAELDLDWEELLSPLLGDTLVHRAGIASHSISDWVSRTQDALTQNTEDYLQEELGLLAPNSEVKAYCADVDDIRATADRLEARLKQLEKTRQLRAGEDAC